MEFWKLIPIYVQKKGPHRFLGGDVTRCLKHQQCLVLCVFQDQNLIDRSMPHTNGEPSVSTWRIIPVSKWLVTPIYKPFRPFGRGTALLRGLTITMVINHVSIHWDDPPSKVLFRHGHLWKALGATKYPNVLFNCIHGNLRYPLQKLPPQ